MSSVTLHCNTAVSHREYAVERTEPGWYLVYLRQEHLVRTTCANGSDVGVTMRGYRAFQVDPGCGLYSPKFAIDPSRMTELRMSVALDLKWTVPNLLEGQSVANVSGVREDLLRRSVRPEDSVSALLDQAVAWAPRQEPLQTHLTSAISGVALVTVIGVMSFLACRYRRQPVQPPGQ